MMDINEKQLPRNPRTPLHTVVPIESPYAVFVDVCGKCNFKCFFCPCNTTGLLKEKRHAVMPLPGFKRLIDDISQFSIPPKTLNFGVFGEPLLNKDFISMVDYTAGHSEIQSLRITTNASRLDEAYIDALMKAGQGRLKQILISIEALNEEGYLTVCGYKMDYPKFVKNIEYLYKRASEVNCEIAVKVMNTTLGSKEDEALFYNTFKDISHCHYIDIPQQRWNDFDCKATESRGAVAGAHNFTFDSVGEEPVCTFPLTNITVHANGDCSPCCVDWKHLVVFGNVFEKNITEIWKGRELHQIRTSLIKEGRRGIPYCSGCLEKSKDDINATKEIVLERLEKAYNAG